MTSSRFARISLCAIAALAACVGHVRSAAAQWIPEIAGGWSYRQAAPPNDGFHSDHYGLGFNARLSVGRRIADHLLLRLDAFVSQSSENDTTWLPGAEACIAASGCSVVWSANHLTKGVAGLTMNAIVELDPRGVFYVIGGTGVDNAYGHTPAGAGDPATFSYNDVRLAASLGAGIALPIAAHLRATVEARVNRIIGATSGTQWFAPIAIGLRY